MFRQELFHLRDELFLEAARGHLSFDDVAYGMLRTMIQRTLAASEDINVVQVLVAMAVAPRLKGDVPLSTKLENCLHSMREQDRAKIYEQYYRSMMTIIATHFIRIFPVPVFGFFFVWVLYRLPGRVWRKVLEFAQRENCRAASDYVESAFHMPDGAALA
jgi:hypothetical protein